jgi:leucyl-tRNA synthetase
MSKSRGNVVEPDDIIQQYGADTARLFSLFAAPPEKDLEWSSQGVEGASRFLNRLWRFVEQNQASICSGKDVGSDGELSESLITLRRTVHATIKKVTEDIEERFHFNTAIAAIMELVRALMDVTPEAVRTDIGKAILHKSVLQLLMLLFPFVPHFANELWEALGEEGSLDHSRWPTFDPEFLKTEDVLVVVQVNGKVRSRLMVPRDEEEDKLRQRVLEDEKIRMCVKGRSVKRVIIVPEKIVNVVV